MEDENKTVGGEQLTDAETRADNAQMVQPEPPPPEDAQPGQGRAPEYGEQTPAGQERLMAAAAADQQAAVADRALPGSPASLFPDERQRTYAIAHIAEMAHAVLQAEGHAWPVLQGNARKNITEEVERQMHDHLAPVAAGASALIRALIDSAAPILYARPY